MKRKPNFTSADELQNHIDNYFASVNNGSDLPEDSAETTKNKQPAHISTRCGKPAPPTITGLALFLGFNNISEFDKYTAKVKFASVLMRARLRIESEYEKKLHLASPSGAIFALKNLGWNEKTDDKTQSATVLKIKIIETGPELAGSEKEVIL